MPGEVHWKGHARSHLALVALLVLLVHVLVLLRASARRWARQRARRPAEQRKGQLRPALDHRCGPRRPNRSRGGRPRAHSARVPAAAGLARAARRGTGRSSASSTDPCPRQGWAAHGRRVRWRRRGQAASGPGAPRRVESRRGGAGGRGGHAPSWSSHQPRPTGRPVPCPPRRRRCPGSRRSQRGACPAQRSAGRRPQRAALRAPLADRPDRWECPPEDASPGRSCTAGGPRRGAQTQCGTAAARLPPGGRRSSPWRKTCRRPAGAWAHPCPSPSWASRWSSRRPSAL